MAEKSEKVRQALVGYRELNDVLPSMSEDELRAALDLESDSLRRPVLIERMIQRLVRLIEMDAKERLNRRYAPWLVKSQSS